MSISQKNTRVLITIPKELKKELDIISKKEKRSLSNLCAKIISDYVEKEKGDN